MRVFTYAAAAWLLAVATCFGPNAARSSSVAPSTSGSVGASEWDDLPEQAAERTRRTVSARFMTGHGTLCEAIRARDGGVARRDGGVAASHVVLEAPRD